MLDRNHHQLTTETPFERILGTVNGLRPNVIRSYGTYLEAALRLVAARRLRMLLPLRT